MLPLRDLKPIRSVFVAYPYDFGQSYRDALATRFAGSAVELRYADDIILNAHVMEKIRRMMADADVCMFDVTDNNPNVMLELGYALGAEEPGFVVVRKDAVDALSADITGWDQLRYADLADLAGQVHYRVTSARVPRRRPTVATPERDPAEVLRELRFGIPAISAPFLLVFAIPAEYKRHYKDRALLGKPPFRAEDLCKSVLAGPNETGHKTHFWSRGFNYVDRPGPDFVEVYDGRSGPGQADREMNFRVYTSGAVTYMQRLRYGGADNKPFLYLSMFEEIVEMALIAIAHARDQWDFTGQGDLYVGAVFQHAADLRVSEATREFYPEGDAGRPVIGGDELWIPDIPIVVDAAQLSARAKALAEEMTADLATKLV